MAGVARDAAPHHALAVVGVVGGVAALRAWALAAAVPPPAVSTTTQATVVLWCAAALALVLYKPWRLPARTGANGKPVRFTEGAVVRILGGAIVLAVTTGATLYVTRVLGPLRTVLLEASDLALPGVAGVAGIPLVVWAGSRASRRASFPVLLALCAGACAIAWWGGGRNAVSVDSAATAPATAPGGLTSDGDALLEGGLLSTVVPRARGRGAAVLAAAGRVKAVLDANTPASVVLAVLMIVVAGALQSWRRGLVHDVAVSSGLGARRTHAIVIVAAAALWTPVAVLRWLMAATPLAFPPLLPAAAYGAVALLLTEVALEVPPPHPADPATIRFAMTVVTFVVGLLSGGLSGEGTLSLLVGAALFLPALAAAADVSPAGVVALVKGGAVGSAALPLARSTSDVGPSAGGSKNGNGPGGHGLDARWAAIFARLWANPDSRKILIFLGINGVFMLVEVVVGLLSNSLGLISDAGHMLFDNASLLIGLYASYMAKWKPDAVYTYGYARYEVLAGFVNAIFLIFVAVSVVFEAVERLWEPPEVHGQHLLPVAIMGFCVNAVGLVFFHDHSHGHGGGDTGHHGHSHGGEGENENMHGVFLHVLADALGSLGVITSSLCIRFFGWRLADPLASIFISLLILASAGPLISATAGPLLSAVPKSLATRTARAAAAVRALPQVSRLISLRVWKHHSSVTVATARLSLHPSAVAAGEEQAVLRRVRALLSAAGATDVTVGVLDDAAAVGEATDPWLEDLHGGAAVPDGDDHAHSDDHSHEHGHSHSHGDTHGHGHGANEAHLA